MQRSRRVQQSRKCVVSVSFRNPAGLLFALSCEIEAVLRLYRLLLDHPACEGPARIAITDHDKLILQYSWWFDH